MAGWLIFVVALFLATLLGNLAETGLGIASVVRQILQAAVVASVVVPGIYALRRFGDGGSLRGLGLSSPAGAWAGVWTSTRARYSSG